MRRPVPGSLLLAALLGAAGFAARALPDRDERRLPPREEHEEGRYKRARALESSLARASSGRQALSPEGTDRGYDVLTYDLALDVNPAVVAIEGEARIRLSALRNGVSEVRLDLDDAMAVRSVERDGTAMGAIVVVGAGAAASPSGAVGLRTAPAGGRAGRSRPGPP